ncbi:DUF1048 domain-containing protein [Lactococcus formosensis]|uniref:DUF1048 domain-containing protein n=1 Tax=Lactococcus formosensis TaxID=1281486 RepID=UPI002096FB76|nr:DUF1048 domain-containing protein [Lactococcus formosensis]MCO7181442.1 DUF1048 domain-containing protein [Lactococcus formosensis]
MNFWDRITGRDMTVARADFAERVKCLPESYQSIWAELDEEVQRYSDLTGRNLIPIMSSLLEFFEETSFDYEDVSAVIGDNKEAFVAELFDQRRPIPNKSYRDKCREQLNRNVAKKLGRQ